jgi:Putative Flp pilus-assembly TadE/G-like
MRTRPSRRDQNSPSDAGQATLFVLLALGLFLVGAVAFCVDIANLWFHRQSAQNAADAACTAGAMDLLVDANTGITNQGGFTAGTAFDCLSTPNAAPCKYAALNGYNGTNASPGNSVSVSFPGSVPGVTTPPPALAPTPFIRVDVLDHVQTFFSGMLSGSHTQDVRAFAVCGLVLVKSPVPIVVLDRHNPSKGSALNVQGNPDITIFGGPSQSIQVNSDDSAAVTIAGSAIVDLTLGGPNNTGSSFGVTGGPTAPPGGFITGPTGHWMQHSPINDPFADVAAPAQPPDAPAPVPFLAGDARCPGALPCTEYYPGHYRAPGIQVKHATAIFVEGLYYLDGGLTADPNSCLRPSPDGASDVSNQIGGTIFYLTGSGSLNVDSNSGSKCPATAPFNTTAGTGTLTNGIKCTATSSVPTNMPATLTGNVLLAPCTGTYGDPLGAADPLGVQRGMLFFLDRSVTNANPSWGGGGTFLLAGDMYFHSCDAAGDGGPCGPTGTYYTDNFTLQGNAGSTTYLLGDIITDNLQLGGTSGITMDLNPNKAYDILKVSLLR